MIIHIGTNRYITVFVGTLFILTNGLNFIIQELKFMKTLMEIEVTNYLGDNDQLHSNYLL